MGKCYDLSNFYKGQIMMARQLGHSISKIAGLVGCSWYAVVSANQKWKYSQLWAALYSFVSFVAITDRSELFWWLSQ